MASPTTDRVTGPTSLLTGAATGAAKAQRARLEERGDQLLFYAKALAWTPRAVTRAAPPRPTTRLASTGEEP